VYEVYVKSVSEVSFHCFVRYEICLGLDGACSGVDADGFPLVSFSLVAVDLGHYPVGDIVDYDSVDSGRWCGYGVEVHVVGAEAPVSVEQCRLCEEGGAVNSRCLSGEAQAADGLKYSSVSQRAVDKQLYSGLDHVRSVSVSYTFVQSEELSKGPEDHSNACACLSACGARVMVYAFLGYGAAFLCGPGQYLGVNQGAGAG